MKPTQAALLEALTRIEVAANGAAATASRDIEDWREDMAGVGEIARAALRAAEAAQPEPVAWMDAEGRVLSAEQMHNATHHQGGPGLRLAEAYSTPLYAASPQPAPIAAQAEKHPRSALARYQETAADGAEPETPLERLRYFCSLAMQAQDWLDVEPFFDALVAAQAGPSQAPLTDEQIVAIEERIWKSEFFDSTERQANREFVRAIERAHGIGAQAPEGWREIVEQLIACHDEPTCPAVAVAKEWLAAAPQAPAEPAAQAVEQDATLPVHEVWREGYRITGESGEAVKLGEVEAENFDEACDKLCTNAAWQAKNGNYDPKRRTVWGCRLFNNEADARKAFG